MRSGRVAAVLLAASLAAAGAAGCGGAQRQETPAEWLDQNTFILDQLRSYDKKELHEGINRFLRLGKDRGTAVVNYILNDAGLKSMSDYRLEVVLARILAEWKDTRAIPTLLANLEGTDSGALAIVKEGLIVYGDEPRIMEAMKEELDKGDAEMRRTCAEVLSEMKGPEALMLLGQHRRTEADATIRGLCVLAILNGRDPSRLSLLIDCLEDGDPGIREQAWLGITRRRPPVQFNSRAGPAARAQAVQELRAWFKAGARPAAEAGAAPSETRDRP